MFGKKKKSPSVKIPSGVLKKEAQRMAKQMIKAEEKRERMRIKREKAKEKAKKTVKKQKNTVAFDEHFFSSPIKREIAAGTCFALAAGLIALLFSNAPAATEISGFFRDIFGVGTWFLPLILIGKGIFFLQKINDEESILKFHFPPSRIIALVLFFGSILGMINLLLPHEESLALSHKYGGALGFALGFFPREFFGTTFTFIFFLGILWVCTTIGFRVHVSELFRKGKIQKAAIKNGSEKITIEKNTPAKKIPEKSEPKKPEKPSRFKNELQIVDSTKAEEKPKKIPEKSEPDMLETAKQKTAGKNWQPPSLDILKPQSDSIVVNEKILREQAEKIREKLEQFGIEVTMKSVHVGPTVTQFTLEPSAGVKLNKITTLKNDLALTLAAESVRIEAPIRGKSLVGIEIPNEKRAVVGFREILESDVWKKEKSKLKMAFGRDVAGKPMIDDLAKMPHALIAGKTGSGKSVAMNAFLCSLLWNNSPDELKLILIDPKRVELKRYDKIPHLLTPVIVEPEKAVSALAWAVAEMNRRYRKLSEEGVVNLKEYNEKFKDAPEPNIVIVVDELADLMMVAGKDVEAAICRIAQMARAVGMHLLIATQRPSVDVVTGLIKANLPARIAFRVSSGIDSRTIIDGIGAEDLLGMGDMLSLDGNSGQLTRVQGIYISNDEVERITNHFKLQFPEMMTNDEITKQSIEGMAKGGVLTAGREAPSDEDLDDRFEEAVTIVLENNKASASFLQRRMEVGYARAAKLLDQMEAKGIIGPSRGAKAREIYGRQD